jgi:uncharacterized iron-regulated membrane protein
MPTKDTGITHKDYLLILEQQFIIDFNMHLRKIFNKVHLWLGLASGIIIVIIALTGALWVFETEIQDLCFNYRKVSISNKKDFLPPSQLKKIAQPFFDNKPIQLIQYKEKDKAALVRAWGKENEKEYNITVYINPYTGQLLHVKKSHNFFDIVIELHTNLMLGNIGKKIIDFSTVIFLIMIISGLILWWPKNKNRVKNSFRIKWNANFKRKNYDLHNVFGFYATWVLIFTTITGLAWGFETIDKSIYHVATGGATFKDFPYPNSISDTNTTAINNIEDYCFIQATTHYNKPFASAEIYYPEQAAGNINIGLNPSSKTYYKTSNYFYDQRTATQLLQTNFKSGNNGEKIRNMYYDIHIGKILGLTGQLLVFFSALIAASLPITGFLIWRGRHKKNKMAII